ncbi:protein AUXIN SIGNALING F-BOX 3-like isoform X2 [Durio zibethinus]|uniref:Protein AUXIN SIGNALING F-BOX 3-like isoform X2 n=1 Tax=Durio zibethinus TaxID=66656 RepID=A0A6P5WIP4_DURZI|nr:protein AUXIN SIGNALING F-BOX 3-like isoform X2 [Durio zibethinus]
MESSELKRSKDSPNSDESAGLSSFPDEVLERVLSLLKSHRDRSFVSLVCKDWYNAERWSRTHVFIGNCYSVSPEIVARRFPNIRSVTLKGKPRFSDFNLVPQNWGADIHAWLVVFAAKYPFLEELRLKRMAISDESLALLAVAFPNFKALSLLSCDGFSTNGLAAIATNCKNLTELDIQENGIDDKGGSWLGCFPESFTSLEVLNFANLTSDINFDALERLVGRCKSMRVLKLNRSISLEQLQRLLVNAPQLAELGTGSFSQELTFRQYKELECTLSNRKNMHTLSGLWEAKGIYLPALYPACTNLTFLNLSYAALQSSELAKLLAHCPRLKRLWVLDTVQDKGLEAIGLNCPLLEELRVFPDDPFGQPDYLTNEPMDEAFGAVVKTCTKLQRLSVSGLLTDLTFEYIGRYAKNLETLSVAFAGSSDWGMQCVLGGCPKLRKLEIRDCPFGNAALLSGLEKYESMRSLWMSACKVTMNGCRLLAREMPRLNVEVMKEDGSDDSQADKVYVYRSIAGPRRDAPPSVLTL